MSDPVRDKRLNDMVLGDLEDALNALEMAIQSPTVVGTPDEDTLKDARENVGRIHFTRSTQEA